MIEQIQIEAKRNVNVESLHRFISGLTSVKQSRIEGNAITVHLNTRSMTLKRFLKVISRHNRTGQRKANLQSIRTVNNQLSTNPQ